MERFDEFLKERLYFKNVSQKTLVYYKCAIKSWQTLANGDWKTWLINLRQAGVSAIFINTYICAMNTHWKRAGSGTKLDYLKEERKVLATFSAEQVRRIIHWKPVGRNETRAHALALTAPDKRPSDTGVAEPVASGRELRQPRSSPSRKGNKQRLVPMSIELLKTLYRYLSQHPITRSPFPREMVRS